MREMQRKREGTRESKAREREWKGKRRLLRRHKAANLSRQHLSQHASADISTVSFGGAWRRKEWCNDRVGRHELFILIDTSAPSNFFELLATVRPAAGRLGCHLSIGG